ncbi:MAG: transglycosylase SLT domain-containing protein [Anaerolineae bacterium]
MNDNNRSRRSQQAKSSSADRRTPSAHPSSDIYRYDARLTFEDFDEEPEVDGELEYEDDGDFLDSQGVQPAPEPKVVRKPYNKRLPSNRPNQRPAARRHPNSGQPQFNGRRPIEWQDEELFDELEDDLDDPVFDEIEVYDDEYAYAPNYQADYARSNGGRTTSTFRRPQPVQIVFVLVGIMIVGLLLMSRPLTAGLIDRMARTGSEAKAFGAQADALANNLPATGRNIAATQLSPFFSQSVLYWEADIVRWAGLHNLDPNMVATVMQIESCGDPRAQSGAGAMGLFQVMPFHFQAGEDGFDPDTNALRGMNYLAERLIQTGGEIGHAFAGYNGGHAAAASNWNSWANETQRYYKWTTGVYSDSLNGNRSSDTLEQWIVAGGASLCAQAEQRLGLQ